MQNEETPIHIENPPKADTEQQREITDIFHWANQTDSIKNELDVEFFLFNKNYTPYITKFGSDLQSHIKPLFLYDVINFVTLGGGTGLAVRDFEKSDGEENTLLRTDLENVGRAETLLHLIEHERRDIVEFDDTEHDFKRIKGIVARFTYKNPATGKISQPFYAIKAIAQGSVLHGASSWEFRDGKFGSFQADVGLKVPTDNQVVIVARDIFVFNQAKFEKLFNYNYKKQALADKKVEEILKEFKLSFPDGLDLQTMVRERKKIVSKLQKMEIGSITQKQALELADTMHLELMTDDADAIIIMDNSDLDTFVNLINEDYMTSEITGKRYEIKTKKELDEPSGGEAPRG